MLAFGRNFDGKFDRTEGNALHYSLFVSSALSVGFAGAGLWVAIALLACVLGAEIAGICILVSKMLRAREAKRKDAYLAELKRCAKSGGLSNEEAKQAFVKKFDWDRMTAQDDAVWKAIFDTLDA